LCLAKNPSVCRRDLVLKSGRVTNGFSSVHVSPSSECHKHSIAPLASRGFRHLFLQGESLQFAVDRQPLLNIIVALWASAHLPGLLTHQQREHLIGEIVRLQREDGGWSLADLGTWKRVDNTALVTRTDGYATGLIVLTLEENRARNAAPTIERGRAWLIANQDKSTGAWPAWSLNKDRDPKSPAGTFMSDAATAYAVLALEARR
jgi:hypothetical protein